jgi:hypothetical protein
MSLYKSYSPKTLWLSSLKLVHTFFHTPPKLPVEPASYFSEVIRAHKWIKNDLSGHFEQVVNTASNGATIGQIHASLQELSQTLFDCKSEWPATVKGCQLYTEELTLKLSGSCLCSIV